MEKIICANCNFSYNTGISIINSTATITNNKIQCPKCGYSNIYSPGTNNYDRNGKIIKKFLKEADLSQNELKQFSDLLKSVSKDNSKTIEELKTEADKIKPNLGRFFDLKPITTDGLLVFIIGVIQIIATFLSNSPTTTINNTTINNYNTTYVEGFSKDFERQQRLKNLEKLRSRKTAQKKRH